MTKKWLVGTSLLLVIVITLVGLIQSASWLSLQLLGVPLGNLMTMLTLVSLAIFPRLLEYQNQWLQRLLNGSLILALSWYPIGIVWAGNLRLSFSGNGNYWLPFSYSVAGFCLSVTLVSITFKIVASRKR